MTMDQLYFVLAPSAHSDRPACITFLTDLRHKLDGDIAQSSALQNRTIRSSCQVVDR